MHKGEASVMTVPAPTVEPGALLISVAYSCISAGTEIAGVRSSGDPLWRRALKHPDEVSQILHMIREQGVRRIHRMVKAKLSTATALGYSAAGIVLAVGEGVTDIKVGDRVACSGAQCAHHAEIISVPRNLVALIPEGVDYPSASTVTLGAIALQGVRRLNPTLGESIMVLGLGIIGQITVQLLKANGCKVVGLDVDRDRLALARSLGADHVFHPDDGDVLAASQRVSDGYGLDGVIITAGSSSNEPLATAFKVCRKKGRVVLVGDVGLTINREDIFKKEIDFKISASYGPGRYDPTYEEGGIDYPQAYVRWTENRNLSEYLYLIATKKVLVEPLITKVVDLEGVSQAYASLKAGGDDLIVLIHYPEIDDFVKTSIVMNPNSVAAKNGIVRIGLIGAGSFAKGMHLLNIEAMPEKMRLHAVASRTGLNATQTALQFGASYSTTDIKKILEDQAIDALLIATRHNLHSKHVMLGLRAGKHILVEKPLSLTSSDLEEIVDFYRKNPQGPVLLTGFNRRFSLCGKTLRAMVSNRAAPMILNYTMNVGHIPLSDWVQGEEGGGRNLGEACHIYDLFTFLTDSKVTNINAISIHPKTGYYAATDNFVATMSFADGSVATLTYTALGCKAYSKEVMEVFVDGKVITIDDYRSLIVHGYPSMGIKLKTPDKGQKQELLEFAECIQVAGAWPIPLWQQIQATEIALQVEKMIK